MIEAHRKEWDWVFTRHALARMASMGPKGLKRRHVVRAIEQAETDVPNHTPGRRVASRGSLAVVYCPEARVIVTVLWRGRDVTRPPLEAAERQ